jgi:fatty acid-binding protein DegV
VIGVITDSAASLTPDQTARHGIDAADDGEGVVICTVSGRLSSTLQAATLAARLSDRQIEVVDTGTAAGAEGLVALAAAATARGGAPLEVVAKRAVQVAQEVRLIADVGDLSHLRRTGRLAAPLASLGGS